MTDNENVVVTTRESATKAWVAGIIGVVLAALWVYQPAVSAGVVDLGTHLNAIIAALVTGGALFGGTYATPNRTITTIKAIEPKPDESGL